MKSECYRIQMRYALGTVRRKTATGTTGNLGKCKGSCGHTVARQKLKTIIQHPDTGGLSQKVSKNAPAHGVQYK